MSRVNPFGGGNQRDVPKSLANSATVNRVTYRITWRAMLTALETLACSETYRNRDRS